jgi:D-citramalate synthase
MDTTLRDGEQTPDVAYTPAEKLQIARLLLTDVGVDRIEIASSRVSKGEREAARRITEWARKKRLLPRIEILGYCDGRASVDWIAGTGGRVLNLLIKGSERHCRTQLGMTPEQHRYASPSTTCSRWCSCCANSACNASTCPTRSACSPPMTSAATWG